MKITLDILKVIAVFESLKCNKSKKHFTFLKSGNYYLNLHLSYAEIENRTGHNYRTIKKYIELEDFNIPIKVKAVSPKSDLIRPYVKEILKADKEKRKKFRHTAKRIYEVLKEKQHRIFTTY